MPFFESAPPPPIEREEPGERVWMPPRWDRPSEGVLPAVVAVSEVFGRTDDVVLALDHFRVYPNGFVLVTSTQTNPRLPWEHQMGGFTTMMLRAQTTTGTAAPAGTAPGAAPTTPAPAPPVPDRIALRRRGPMAARFGVQFSDGSRAGAGHDNWADVPRDDDGVPTAPIMGGGGGGGGGGNFRWEHWVFPLPTPGPLEVFAEWSEAGIGESSIVVSGDAVRDAATRAIVLWS